MLERRRPSMPEYRTVGAYTTHCFRVGVRPRAASRLTGGTLAPATATPTNIGQAAADSTLAPIATLAPTEPAGGPLSFETGRNDYVSMVDDAPRRFIIYVPAGYDPATLAPVVFKQ